MALLPEDITSNRLTRMLIKIIGVDKLAERYERHEDLSGPEFISAFLKDLDMRYEVEGLEHLQHIADGPFITVSNHPYGGIDGLVLIDLFGRFREDYKVMANKFLSQVKTIEGNFISVVPKTNDTKGVTQDSIEGVKNAIRHVRENHPLGLFPAGAVSDFSFRDRCVRDREWQASAIRLIQKMRVPVVPVCFFDQNSDFFYFLGLISWKIRTLRLPHEILNKQGKTIRLGIGPVITVEAQDRWDSSEEFGRELRASVYGLKQKNES